MANSEDSDEKLQNAAFDALGSALFEVSAKIKQSSEKETEIDLQPLKIQNGQFHTY